MDPTTGFTGLVWRPLIGFAAAIVTIVGLVERDHIPTVVDAGIVGVGLVVTAVATVATVRQARRWLLRLR